ncbi:peptidoglycan-binding domain-containing protein [Streptomyces glaucescens]|uniref:Peptidoglycan-binding membrane protein n=1 Tax=Streptomyces glaucescens TaxID=1907 RepID=A0A089XAH4_STRGA|nr:peptidoglycan-binding protein [Streptomyces glaucescens]AIR98159.1 peptidoglycan-binding membrane protein [Streptomyces glaucescens]
MAEPKGHTCPECGAVRGADNTPSCACGERAADALRDARTAEQAAAEDFDPLRIRPYVDLDGAGEPQAAPGGSASDAEPTMPLRPVEPEPATTVLPTPLAPPAAAPSADDLGLFDEGARDPGTAPAGPGRAGTERPRRRRTAALVVSGGVVAVIAAAALAGGLFSYDPPSRDTALPEDVREAVPEARTSAAAPSAPAPGTASASASASSASPSASESTSPSASPSPSRSSASPTPTPTPTPTPAPSTTTARPSVSAVAPEEDPPVLQRGDRGPEVTELQLRLRQLYLYNDDAHGTFDQSVEQALRNYQSSRGLHDELSVYGPRTREALERETREP